MSALVSLDHVTCAYDRDGARPVLADVSLSIEAGAFTGIVGPSGSGKTTLLRAVLGTVPPASGTVTRRRGLRVGYVPQVETVDWSFPVTVREAVLMARTSGRRLPWMSRAERAEVDDVLARLGLGDGIAGRHIRELSGGQQQRVFVARALLRRPDLLLLDEPTSGVDVRTRHEVLHLLGDLNADGLAIALTTHDLNGIAAHLPHLVCLNTSVIGEGAPREVLTPAVLERTYGAPMEVLEHGGMPVVVDGAGPRLRSVG
ncbi:MAG TPA: metal ABC transporter ATP-binding protein [Acidimicrobiales bacterium]|nr:metal ABC transporter ATP-binding protein [Acidimicrobiales bacterium]